MSSRVRSAVPMIVPLLITVGCAITALADDTKQQQVTRLAFDDYIRRSVPLVIPLLMAFFSAITALAGDAKRLLEEQDSTKRSAEAWSVIRRKLPVGLCLSGISFDIWAITTLQSGTIDTLKFYSLDNNRNAIAPLMVVHLVLYLFALLWDGITQGNRLAPGYWCAMIAILLCAGVLIF